MTPRSTEDIVPAPCCYVCLNDDDPRPLYRPCLCDRLVHEACHTELVNTVPAHRDKCPVCLKEHSGETYDVITRRDVVVRYPFLYTIDSMTLLHLLLYIVVLNFVEESHSYVHFFFATTASISILWSGILHAALYLSSRRCLPYDVHTTVEQRIAVALPDAEEVPHADAGDALNV